MATSSDPTSAHQVHEDLALLIAMRKSQGLITALSFEARDSDYHLRLSHLQQYICDLLLRNQQLRISLIELQNTHGPPEFDAM